MMINVIAGIPIARSSAVSPGGQRRDDGGRWPAAARHERPAALRRVRLRAGRRRHHLLAHAPRGDDAGRRELNDDDRDVAIIADEYDDRIAARYGGQTMQELLEESVIEHFRTAHGQGSLQVRGAAPRPT